MTQTFANRRFYVAPTAAASNQTPKTTQQDQPSMDSISFPPPPSSGFNFPTSQPTAQNGRAAPQISFPVNILCFYDQLNDFNININQ